jgi:hypothetical protein
MRNTVTVTTTTTDESEVPTDRLAAFDESRGSAGLFTEPVDVSVLHELQVDEYGRRWHWVPADCLL